LKRAEQKGLCAICGKPLPERDCILDRLKAMRGYTVENTRLLCRECDFKVQTERKFAWTDLISNLARQRTLDVLREVAMAASQEPK
jgi:hypothetical protein